MDNRMNFKQLFEINSTLLDLGRWYMSKPKLKSRATSEEKPDKKFFETLPGIITAIATLVTAIGGCLTILLSPQILDRLFPQETATPAIVQTVTATPSVSIPTPAPIDTGPSLISKPVPPIALDKTAQTILPRALPKFIFSSIMRISSRVFHIAARGQWADGSGYDIPAPGMVHLPAWKL
jgi:hypothetical protein